jgi:hypothetical protein
VVDPQLPLHELDPQLEQLFSEQLFEQLFVEQLVSQVLAQLPQLLSATMAGAINRLNVKNDLKNCFIEFSPELFINNGLINFSSYKLIYLI